MPPTKESGPEPYEPHTWSVNVPPDDYIGQLEAERDALREALEKIAVNAIAWHGDDAAKGRALAVIGKTAHAVLERPE